LFLVLLDFTEKSLCFSGTYSFAIPSKTKKEENMIYFLIFLVGNTAGIVNKGNRYYKKGDYEKAVKHYQDAGARAPDNPYIQYNLGDALYKKNALNEAVDAYLRALSSKNKKIKEKALFNLGNAYFASDSLKQAINSYIGTLLLNPKNKKAKKNLEIALKRMKQKKQQKKQTKNKKQKQKQQKKKNQNLQQILNAIKQNQKRTMKKMMRKKGGQKSGAMDW